MSKVLVVLMCYLLAFNFATKTGKGGESGSESDENDDEKRLEIGENNPDPLKPLVLIVNIANLNELFNVEPEKTTGVPLDRLQMQDTDVDSHRFPLHEHQMYLCPHPSVKDILGRSHDDFKFVYNCLFVTKFAPNESKKCAEQPKSIIFVYKKNTTQTTSIRNGKFAVKFCYPVTTENETAKCHTKGIRKFFTTNTLPISEVAIKRNYLNLYRFGYNEAEERTQWTVQTVIPTPTTTYWSFTEQPDENVLTKNGHTMLENSFDALIDAYNAQDKTMPHWLAHRLAQPTQYPFNIMTMATSEIINTAPLHNTLQPLIYLIEERIQRLSDHISSAISVMTKPLYDRFDGYDEELYLEENRKFAIPNGWSKQVYHRASNTGIVIVVHNHPEYVPPEGLLCKEKAYCNFKKWKTESSQFKDAFDENLIKFAYCCKVTKFGMFTDVNITKVIDINFDFEN